MDLLTYLKKSTVQIIIAKKDDERTPVSSGTGFFLNYQDKIIITTVAHVTDFQGNYVLINTNMESDENNKHPFFHVGGMVYYDSYDLSDKSLNKNKVDFTFEVIKDRKILAQIRNENIIFHLNESGKPCKTIRCNFRGSIKHKLEKNIFGSQANFEFGMKFLQEIEEYYIFKCKKEISTEFEYAGCSGAAVVEDTGKLIGSVAEVIPGTKFIKVFPISKGKKLIDYAIQTKTI